jgi:hypothetical protein
VKRSLSLKLPHQNYRSITLYAQHFATSHQLVAHRLQDRKNNFPMHPYPWIR